MSRLTKAQQIERTDQLTRLREWIKPGDTVYTILDHVSSSGMSRAIRVVVPYTRDDGSIDHLHPNYAVGLVLGLRRWKRNGREQDALIIGGCGMDMGFQLVYLLSHALYPDYACLGKGKCPSNYHVNCRRVPNPDGPERFDLLHTDGYALRHRWL